MNEEDAIKRKLLQQKMEEQQAVLMQVHQQAAQAEAMMQHVKQMLAKFLEPKARERLANLKLTKPELATQIEVYLAQLYQSGQIKHVSDEQLVTILKKVTEKRETKIVRK